MNVWVILPTYNERENIGEIVRRLLVVPLASLHILIVDDGSPDGTGAIADVIAQRERRVTVLHREKKDGLAQAYVAGFHVALAAGAEVVVEMDADLSHDPAVLPLLLAKLDHADLVLGSRYITGGRIENWNWWRRRVSRWGNWYAQHVLGVGIRDLTGGYKCFRRSTLERIDLHTVSSTGYNFQIELTFKTLRAGLRVVEAPITFVERRLGRSKFHGGIIWESMIGVWRLRNLRNTQTGA